MKLPARRAPRIGDEREHVKFAWLPERLDGGSWCWFKRVRVRWGVVEDVHPGFGRPYWTVRSAKVVDE